MQKSVYHFLEGGGEAGRLIAETDWSRTPIKSIDEWPVSLQVTLANILHSAFPMLLFWGHEHTCFYNDAFRPSLGTDGRHPCIGKKGKDVWSDVWEFTGPLLDKVIQTRTAVFFEDVLVPFQRNGSFENIYWTFSYSPAFDDFGKIAGVLVTCMETTPSVVSREKISSIVETRTAELEAANTALHLSNVYLQEVINIFKEPLQVLEAITENGEVIDFRYKLTNASYAAYANVKPEDLKGKRVGEVFPGYFQTTSFVNIVETYITGTMHTWDINYAEDGLNLHNKMTATRFGEEVLVHFTDFTEVTNLQHQLQTKIDQLMRSNQQLQEFAYAASHDLKEPIRKIKTFLSQLQDQLETRLNEKELQLFSKVDNATDRMGSLVDDLLQYSQLIEHTLDKEDLDLGELLSQVIEDLEIDIKLTDASIIIGNTSQIRGYKRQLQQMFQNLISNGIKYRRETIAPVILIKCKPVVEDGKNFHLIEVCDNGIGFDQQYAERIFKMFARLHSREKYSGTGIGLSIVKKVVENHQGFIKVESIEGEGSTFKVYLPSHPDSV